MGDMKTPDFDDLLAAFDIPDATSLDAKEAIRENHDEGEGHLKHTEMCMDATALIPHPVTPTDAPAVSVIVKNTSLQDSNELLVEKEGSHLGHLLENGFKTSASSLETHHVDTHPINYPRLDMFPVNGDCTRHSLENIPVLYKTEKVPTLLRSMPHFSPISSPESEDIQSNGIEIYPKSVESSYFPSDSLFTSSALSMLENHEKSQAGCESSNETLPGFKDINYLGCDASSLKDSSSMRYKEDADKKSYDSAIKSDCMENFGTNAYSAPETGSSASHPRVNAQTSRLSSCLDALAALNSKKDPREQTISRDLPVAPKETMKINQKIPISPRSPRSPLEVVKRFIKQPDSPMSICSDSSGKASPAVATGSPPAIPRVRIKTIKTSSGEIKRTITSILPDSETEDLLSPFGSSPSQSSVEDTFSKTLPVYRSNSVISEVDIEDEKQDTSSTALLGSKSASMKSVRTLKKTQFQSNGHTLNRTQGGNNQRKSCSAQMGSSANTNYLPKALHLANLNLVPHSVAASVTARSSTNRQDRSQLSSPVVCSSVPLVHQVKKVSANTQSFVSNTAAGTLNRLLNFSNPVPTYVPDLSPPPGSNIKLPLQGFCCLECGDAFGLEKSLAYHYSRRSVHIEVACTYCSKTLVFFNKCALLAHAREHKNKGMVMQCTQLFMKPIAVEQMLVPTKTKQYVNQIPYVNNTTESSKSQAVLPLFPDKVIRHGFKCLDCNKQMSDYTALAGHYQNSSVDAKGLMCKVCSMLLPNKCSYRAHHRIHTHKSPYCCPECGALSRSVDIQKHVKENCLHYARKIGYSCLHCGMLFMSLSLFKSHIEEKHYEVFYKCTICPVAFKSFDGCLIHVKSKHGGSEPSHQVIYKCSCETVFKRKQLYYQHFHNRTCVFKCPECTSLFPEKILLVQHFKIVHGGVFRGKADKSSKQTEMTSLCDKISPQNLQPRSSKPVNEDCMKIGKSSAAPKSSGGCSMKNAGWTCGECLLWIPDRETFVNHMKTSHGRSVKRHPCRLCERSFNSPLSLRRHIRSDHDGKKNVYTCWYCTNERVSFSSHSMLKKHISLMHGIKNPDFGQMAKLASQQMGKTTGERPKRRAEEAAKGEKSDGFPAKRLKPLYRCAKCGFTSEDQAQFQEHIPQHRSDSNAPQCQHCSLCFTSQLALSRHLFIVHKVKELEEQEDFKHQLTEQGGANSADLTDESKPVRLLPKKTGLSTEKQCKHPSNTLTCESINSAFNIGKDTQASETGEFTEEEKA
ncbi:zinc finger protein 592-like isoform X1 [Xyrauchen texanus]|uniref:zinc finger protein 592-like isoform X1 n=1 Tax=Xyrauchen texanus TaxID=154827 RepID=UPI0022426691|nr:zinc finger protein 592-like isoform X1 [Xyrauchen texanus]XP_051953755.1 zinc finger protein 592-like isoform X1 [Xyrauchen texanus]